MPSHTSPKDSVVVLEGFVHGETSKAILFEIYTINQANQTDPVKHWFPFSQVKRIVKQPKNSQEYDTLVVSEWIMKAKELM